MHACKGEHLNYFLLCVESLSKRVTKWIGTYVKKNLDAPCSYYRSILSSFSYYMEDFYYRSTLFDNRKLCTVECWKFYWPDHGEEGQFLKASTRLATLTANFQLGRNPGYKQVLPPFLQVRHTHLHTYEREHLRKYCCRWIIHLFKIVAKLYAESEYSFYPDRWFYFWGRVLKLL